MNEHPIGNPFWIYFVKWAEANGIDLEHVEDWGPWFECFQAGAEAERNRCWDKINDTSGVMVVESLHDGPDDAGRRIGR